MRKFYIILTVFLLFISGCSGEKVSKEKEIESEENPKVEKVEDDVNKEKEKEVVYEHSFPLTGIGTNDDILQRPYSVMINNHPKARPQSGLHRADIVYEVLAEGFITRFLAIYQSELPDVVGPIRSSRDYYINLSKGYGTIYIAYGGSEEALKLLDSGVTDFVNGIKYKNGKRSFEDEKFYYRADFRKAPHNVYSTKEDLLEAAKYHNYEVKKEVAPLSFRTKSAVEKSSDAKTNQVTITYSNSYNVRYTYDDEKKKYLRFNGEKQTVDLESDIPIEIDNIFIVEASHKVVDSAGRRNIDIKSGGKGLLLQKGYLQEVTWENVDGRILPVDDGKIVPFVIGKTWINIVPTSPGIEESVKIAQ